MGCYRFKKSFGRVDGLGLMDDFGRVQGLPFCSGESLARSDMGGVT